MPHAIHSPQSPLPTDGSETPAIVEELRDAAVTLGTSGAVTSMGYLREKAEIVQRMYSALARLRSEAASGIGSVTVATLEEAQLALDAAQGNV